jgi:hypothetical protein
VRAAGLVFLTAKERHRKLYYSTGSLVTKMTSVFMCVFPSAEPEINIIVVTFRIVLSSASAVYVWGK